MIDGKIDMFSFRKRSFNIYEISKMIQQHTLTYDGKISKLNNTKKSKIVEAVLMGVPINNVIIKKNSSSWFVIISNKTTINSLIDFIECRYNLCGLQYLSKINGKSFKELPERMRTHYEEIEIEFTYSIIDKCELEVLREKTNDCNFTN